eukprot:7391649-Prymnesium_polylepis.5
MPSWFARSKCRTGIAATGWANPALPGSGRSDRSRGRTGIEGVLFRAHSSRSLPARHLLFSCGRPVRTGRRSPRLTASVWFYRLPANWMSVAGHEPHHSCSPNEQLLPGVPRRGTRVSGRRVAVASRAWASGRSRGDDGGGVGRPSDCESGSPPSPPSELAASLLGGSWQSLTRAVAATAWGAPLVAGGWGMYTPRYTRPCSSESCLLSHPASRSAGVRIPPRGVGCGSPRAVSISFALFIAVRSLMRETFITQLRRQLLTLNERRGESANDLLLSLPRGFVIACCLVRLVRLLRLVRNHVSLVVGRSELESYRAAQPLLSGRAV